jgi:hypothetical protein
MVFVGPGVFRSSWLLVHLHEQLVAVPGSELDLAADSCDLEAPKSGTPNSAAVLRSATAVSSAGICKSYF